MVTASRYRWYRCDVVRVSVIIRDRKDNCTNKTRGVGQASLVDNGFQSLPDITTKTYNMKYFPKVKLVNLFEIYYTSTLTKSVEAPLIPYS